MKTETFSYLPPMTRSQIERQVAYILEQGWMPVVEYTDRIDPAQTYWHWWRLPLFRSPAVEDVMAALDACRQQHPDAFIQISAFDHKRQGQTQSFVVYRPE
ncbi:MAG: ribulose bisphosphate carboxylase small subunit [Caldilineae bacterium]|nr:MAG: ribulose bisphosphate carboxylase small subunit [Caldilineae bacterium]